jgi:hypothetical protein
MKMKKHKNETMRMRKTEKKSKHTKGNQEHKREQEHKYNNSFRQISATRGKESPRPPAISAFAPLHDESAASYSKPYPRDRNRDEHNRRRRAILNLPILQTTFPTINGERGTKIRHEILVDERLGRKKNPSRPSHRTRRRWLCGISNENMAPEAVKDISRKVSFCQCPSTGKTHLYDRP